MTTSTTPIVRLVSVAKRYGPLVALAPTTLTLDGARTTVLIGPSGSGKTTLLRVTMGLVVPDGGQVFFGERLMTSENICRLRRRMGYLVQDGGLFPHLCTADNVCLMARYLRWERTRVDERLAELTKLVRLPRAALAQYPHELSGGQKQRVGLMRALMLDPELLLLDEPLAALDPLIRAELQDELAAIFVALGKTVIMVTHDLAEAALFGHSIVLMRDGHIVQQGTISDLVKHPANPFVTRFVEAQRRFDLGALREAD